MAQTVALAQKIYKQIQDLPEESLVELARYVEFLRFKAKTSISRRKTKTTKESRPLKIVKLEGLLKGYDFSPELIAEARREIWKKFKVEES